MTKPNTLITGILVVLAAACGKDSPSAPAGGGDWSAAKLGSHDLTIEGVRFTIRVPDGLPKDPRDPGAWSSAKPEWDHAPHVFTSVLPASSVTSLDAAVAYASSMSSESSFVRKEERPDGYALTDARPSRRRISVTTFKRTGDNLVKCSASQGAEGELPSYDKTRAMLESICDSVTITP